MHVRRTLALAAATPLLLAGCTGEAEPTPKMPDPTTSSPSPSPTESETAEAESPEDFIRRWADENRKMFATGNTEPFLALGPECDDCKRIAETVERIYGAGGKVRWDGWRIRSIGPTGGSGTNSFRFVVNSAPTRYRESSAGPWKKLEGGRVIQFIKLEPADTSWHVVESRELSQ
jgi:hypothetical protein